MYVIILYIGTDKPTKNLLNTHVRDNIAPKWHDLGLQLLNDEQRPVLNNIKGNHHYDAKDSCTEMFKYWLIVDPGATWNKLIEALEVINENLLAQKIKEDILKGYL